MEKPKIIGWEVTTNEKGVEMATIPKDTMHEVAKYLEYADFKLKNLGDIGEVSVRAIGIKSASSLIQSIPMDQAIQQIKSELTGLPETTEIKGELIVTFKPES